MLPPRSPNRKARSRPELTALRIVLSLTRSTLAASRMVRKPGSQLFAATPSARTAGDKARLTSGKSWLQLVVAEEGADAELGRLKLDARMIGNKQKKATKARARL